MFYKALTIDEFNTFHFIGMIRIITPCDKMGSETKKTKMIRLNKLLTEEEMAKFAHIPTKFYGNIGIQGSIKLIEKRINCCEI